MHPTERVARDGKESRSSGMIHDMYDSCSVLNTSAGHAENFNVNLPRLLLGMAMLQKSSTPCTKKRGHGQTLRNRQDGSLQHNAQMHTHRSK